MNILVSRLTWQPHSLGGAEASAEQHVLTLNHLGHNAKLLANFRPKQKLSNKLVRLPAQRNLQQLLGLLVLPFFAVSRSYDIINPHSRTDQISFTYWRFLHRTPVIWKDAGDLVHQLEPSTKSGLGKLNLRLLAGAVARSDHIYTLNSRHKEQILKLMKQLGKPLPAQRISVVPSSINFDDYTVKPNKKTTKKIIATYGRLDKGKGIDDAITAFRNLGIKNLDLWIIGDGPDRDRLESLSGGSSNIRFIGYVNNPSDLLNQVNILLQPSHHEGWGRSVREAMYFGVPVIASRTGGIVDQIEDGRTGILVPAKDPVKLQQAIETLVKNDKKMEQISKAARRKALSEGDFNDLMRKQIIPIFKKHQDN